MKQGSQQQITLSLGWPPTVNHYWKQRKHGGRFISEAGLAFRKEAWTEFKNKYPGKAPLQVRVGLRILASPPDNRVRDIDNILKCLCDSMKHAGVYEDDGLIDAIEIYRTLERYGAVHVTIWPITTYEKLSKNGV